MANRHYLSACREPLEGEGPHPWITPVAESRLPLPYAFIMACSANPRVVRSVLFADEGDDEEEAPAIESDFAEGLSTLMTFLDRLESRLDSATTIPKGVDEKQLRQQIQETREFFHDPRFDGRTHFLLEPLEIYWLSGEPPSEEVEMTLWELSDVESTISHVLLNMLPDKHAPYQHSESPAEIATRLGLDCFNPLIRFVPNPHLAEAQSVDDLESPTEGLGREPQASASHEPEPTTPPEPDAKPTRPVPWWKRLLRG